MTVEGTHQWEWPDSLDALSAAPKNHRLLFENEEVRLFDTCVRPGETVPAHTHRWAGVLYVFSSSDFIRRNGDEKVFLGSRTAGIVLEPETALSSPSLRPHAVESVGDTEIRMLRLEVKR